MAARFIHDPQGKSQGLSPITGDELVERDRIGQRRQPHLVRTRFSSAELVQHNLAQRPYFRFSSHARRSSSSLRLHRRRRGPLAPLLLIAALCIVAGAGHGVGASSRTGAAVNL